MDHGTYVVEGEYLVTVERLSCVEHGKKDAALQRSGRQPLRSASPSVHECCHGNVRLDGDLDVVPKKPKRSSSLIDRLRSSFKSKEKPKISARERSASINSHSNSDDSEIHIQDLSRSINRLTDEENTADEADDIENDNTENLKLHASFGHFSLKSDDKQHSTHGSDSKEHTSSKKLSPTPSQCGMELEELIKNITSGEYLSSSKHTGSSSTSPSSHSKHKFDPNLNLSGHSFNSKRSSGGSASLEIPLPHEYQKLERSPYDGPEYTLHDKDDFLPNAKPQINVDIIMLPSARELKSPSEKTESVHYEKISLHAVEAGSPADINRNENDLNEVKPDSNKPKLSFLNKLKKSFKSCSSDKNKPNIPQLNRPPSAYCISADSQQSLSGSIHGSLHGSLHDKPQTPVLELLAKNPEMCSQDSLNKINRMRSPAPGDMGDVRAVMSDPDLVRSTGTGRSRRTQRAEKGKRRSRSRSLTKFIGNMVQRAKSLTEVSPIPRGNVELDMPVGRIDGDVDLDASVHSPIQYENDEDIRLTLRNAVPPDLRSPEPPRAPDLRSPEPPRAPEPNFEADRPKKSLSFVGRLKRRFSLGKGDKGEKTEKQELSKSTPILSYPQQRASSPMCFRGAKSSENVSITSSTTTTDVRTQIVLKSAKINKGCRCQVCTLVRRNIRSHCGVGGDPNTHHKYEVVLKMNLLGADFMNSECASLASYQSYEVPIVAADGCIASNIQAEIGSVHSIQDPLRTKTESEIEKMVKDFKPETSSTTSSSENDSLNTDKDLSELQNVMSSPRASKQSAV